MFGNRRDLFGHPCGRCSRRWYQSVAKNTGGTGKHKMLNSGRDRLLQQIQGAGDVGVDKGLRTMRHDMRFMEGGSVKNRFNSFETMPYERTVDN